MKAHQNASLLHKQCARELLYWIQEQQLNLPSLVAIHNVVGCARSEKLAFFPKLFSESLVHLEVCFAHSWPLPCEHLVKICSCNWRWNYL